MQEKKYYEIYAVDFDGTLTKGSVWPEIGEPNTPFIEWLISEKARGVKLILWTCREGERLEAAVKWSAEHGLIFDAVNEDIPEIKELFVEKSRKVTATKYFDDLNSWWIDEKDGPLTMDEAITHCYDVAEKHKDCEACCKEHHLLARWLEELKARRKADAFNSGHAIASGNMDAPKYHMKMTDAPYAAAGPIMLTDGCLESGFVDKHIHEMMQTIFRKALEEKDEAVFNSLLEERAIATTNLENFFRDALRTPFAGKNDPIIIYCNTKTEAERNIRENVQKIVDNGLHMQRDVICRVSDMFDEDVIYLIQDNGLARKIAPGLFKRKAGKHEE